MTAKLPDGWSDCTDDAAPEFWATVVQGNDPHGCLAWIAAEGVFGLDSDDRDFEPPAEVRQWLEAEAAKRGEPDGVPS